jgi:hypothetical protein
MTVQAAKLEEEIEVTPAMIEAGADAIVSRISEEDIFNFYSPEDLAIAVYRAMDERRRIGSRPQ